MNLFLNKVVSSIFQIILFTFIPFLVWIFKYRKNETFFNWIGLKNFKRNRQEVFKFALIVIIIFSVLSIFMNSMLKNVNTATSEFYGLGISAIPSALIYSIFTTSFSEEILFRGFLLKRIKNKFNFKFANLIQSLVFGFIHGFMFFSLVGIFKSIIIILFTGFIGYLMGYIDEEKAEGSILPSWFIHAFSNLFSSIIQIFKII